MHPGVHAARDPAKPAFVFPDRGVTVTYGELEALSNQGAQLFRSLGLQTGDHIALMLENHPAFFAVCWAAQRAGLYYTAISYRLQEEEVAYIVEDCGARLFLTSRAQSELAGRLAERLDPGVTCYMLDGATERFASWESALAEQPATPILDETEGQDMLYSSGTTGRPKGILRPLPDTPPSEPLPLYQFLMDLFQRAR